MASCKFTKNLLLASHAETLEDAIKEWAMIYEATLPEVTGLCICQHRLKNVSYMYNRITKLTIIVGSTCLKKFDMASAPITNKYISSLFEKSIHQKKELRKKGEYNTIDDIVKYSKEIEETLIKQCSDIYTNYQTNIFKLRELQGAIHELRDLYGITYLNDVLKLVNDAIETITRRNREIVEENKRKEAEAQETRRLQAEKNKRREAEAQETRRIKAEETAIERMAHIEYRQRDTPETKRSQAIERALIQLKQNEAASQLSPMICRVCLKEFKISAYRDQSCCDYECHKKLLNSNVIEHA